MRRRAVVLAVAAATMLSTPIVRAADTVTGEVVDLSCYLSHPETSKGASHKKCAETCAKKGYAAAIDSAAKTITVEGRKVAQGGLNGIVVESVK